MSTFALRASDTAGRMAEHFGGQGTLRQVTLLPYDHANQAQARTVTDYPLGFVRLQAQVVKDEAGRLVQTDKKEVIVPADQLPAGVVPLKNSRLLLGGKEYEVLTVAAEAPGGVPYEWRLAVQA